MLDTHLNHLNVGGLVEGYGLTVENPLRGSEPAALQRLNRAAAFAENVGDLVDRAVGDDPEQQHIALIRSQPGQYVHDPVAADIRECFGLDVAADSVVVADGTGRHGRDLPASPTVFVNKAVTSDGESPGPEGCLVSGESR